MEDPVVKYFATGNQNHWLQNKSYLTMTGFSDPATNPNPSSGSRVKSTVLGSGMSSGSIGIHFRGSS